jgi:putative transposase
MSRGQTGDESVRDGARQMLAAALDAEVAAYIEQFADQVDENGRRLLVRNGYHHERDVLTAAGAVTVVALHVRFMQEVGRPYTSLFVERIGL